MAEFESTPKAAETHKPEHISVDVKEANDAPVSESQTTPTPSKSQFNANAVEFVPGQFRSSSVPNPAAPVFTPSYHMTPNGFVPINPYAMPYYMYVPTNGAGAPLTAADGSVVVSPVLAYPVAGALGKGGLHRHNSAGTAAARPVRGKDGTFAKPYRKEFETKSKEVEPQAKPSSDSPVVRPEDFPSMLGSGPAPVELSSPEGPKKPSWAAIAKRTAAPPAAVVPKPVEPVVVAQMVRAEPVSPVSPKSPKTTPESPKSVKSSKSAAKSPKKTQADSVEIAEAPILVVAAASRQEPPKEPTASVVPATGKAKLAPWARHEESADTEAAAPVSQTTSDAEVTAPVVAEPIVEVTAEVTPVATQEDAAEDEATPVAAARAEESQSATRSAHVYSIELMRRLRYHEQCKPTPESRAAIPVNLVRQRSLAGEEADDWRAEAAAFAAKKGRNNRLDRRASARIEISAEMLIPSENSWSVAQQNQDSLVDENVRVGRKIFAVLNKLTVEKFHKLSDQLFTECGIAKPAHIITLVKFLFEKATIQHHFIPMYADLCNKCLAWLGSDSAPEELVNSIGPGERSTAAADIFRRVLLERCQAAFYSYFLTPLEEAEDETAPAERSEEEHHKHRLSMLGTVKFVAQLLERRLMTRAVFRNCLDTMLSDEDRTDDHIECACVFLGEIGRLFEKDETAGEKPDQYSQCLDRAMEELEEIAAEPATSARIRFTVMNLIDLRRNKYVVKTLVGQSAVPTKISDVHKQAAKEEHLVRTISKAKNQSSHSLAPSDEWETVPKKTVSANAWKVRTSEPVVAANETAAADLRRTSSSSSSE